MEPKSVNEMTLKELRKLQKKIDKRIYELEPKETRTMGDPVADINW